MSQTLLELTQENRGNYAEFIDNDERLIIESMGSDGTKTAAIAAIVSAKMTRNLQGIDEIKDSDWVKATLYGDGFTLEPEYDARRFWQTADRKFEDTSIGGMYVCNPLPGYTPYADIPKPGIANRDVFSPISNFANLGMGGFYSRAHHDTMRVINCRVGKPEFNSVAGYLTTYFDGSSARLANTGRFTGVGSAIGAVVGTVALVGFFGIAGAIAYLSAKYIAGGLYGILATAPYKFYYVRPTMPLYWLGVTKFVNDVMTHIGMFPAYEPSNVGEPQKFDAAFWEEMRVLYPDIFGKSGFIDVYAIINRSERTNQKVRKAIKEAIDSSDTNEALIRNWSGVMQAGKEKPASTGLTDIVSKWVGTEVGGEGVTGAKNSTESLASGLMSERSVDERYQTNKLGDSTTEEEAKTAFMKDPVVWATEKLGKFKDYLDAEFSDGAAFASFRVHETGGTNESFGNSSRSSDLADKLNQMSSQGRAISNTMAGGNIMPGMQEVVDGVNSVLSSALDTIGFGGVMQAAGAAYADIPEFWDNSSVNLSGMDYTIRLQAPSAHPFSLLQFIWIPLAMLYNLAIPHAAGKAAYTMPFLVEVFDQGHAISRTSIVSNLSVSRGTGNLGFTKDRDMLSCDVNISFKNLSTAMYMPIDTGFTLDPFKTINTYDSTFSDYMSVLGGARLGEQVYKGQKLRIRARQYVRGDIQSITSVDQWAGIIRNLPIINNFDLLYPDSGRGL